MILGTISNSSESETGSIVVQQRLYASAQNRWTNEPFCAITKPTWPVYDDGRMNLLMEFSREQIRLQCPLLQDTVSHVRRRLYPTYSPNARLWQIWGNVFSSHSFVFRWAIRKQNCRIWYDTNLREIWKLRGITQLMSN